MLRRIGVKDGEEQLVLSVAIGLFNVAGFVRAIFSFHKLRWIFARFGKFANTLVLCHCDDVIVSTHEMYLVVCEIAHHRRKFSFRGEVFREIRKICRIGSALRRRTRITTRTGDNIASSHVVRIGCDDGVWGSVRGVVMVVH